MEETKIIETYIFMYKEEDFENKSIHELIKAIWTFSGKHGRSCYVSSKYREWASEPLKKQWKKEYNNIETVLHYLYLRNEKWLKHTKISKEDNFCIYSIIEK